MNKKTKQEVCTNLAAALLDFVDMLSGIETPAEGDDGTTRLYSIEELAKKFGKSKDTIRRWIAEGGFGEIVRTGSTMSVTESGLQKFIDDHSGHYEKRTYTRRTRNRSTAPMVAERI